MEPVDIPVGIPAKDEIQKRNNNWAPFGALFLSFNAFSFILACAMCFWAGTDVQYISIPWSWRHPQLDTSWWSMVDANSSSLASDVMQLSGCSTSLVLMPDVQWAGNAKSGMCHCLSDMASGFVSAPTAEVLNRGIISCTLGQKLATEHGLHENPVWTSNSLGMIVIWNAISMFQLVYVNAVVWAGLIALLLISLIFAGFGIEYIMWVSSFVMLAAVFDTVIYYRILKPAGNGMSDDEQRSRRILFYDWKTSINYIFALPIAVMLFNTTNLNRDMDQNWVSIFFACGVGLAMGSASLFNGAMAVIQKQEKASLTDEDDSSWDGKLSPLSLYNVPTIIILVNSIIFIYFEESSRSTFFPGMIPYTNVAYTSCLSLRILYFVAFMENVFAKRSTPDIEERIHVNRCALEFASRVICTVGVAMDVYALAKAG